MSYNMSNFTGADNPYQMVTSINTLSGNFFGPLMVIGLFIIILVNLLRNNPPAESFFGASTLSAIFCLFLVSVNITSIVWLIGFTLLWGVSGVSLYITNKT